MSDPTPITVLPKRYTVVTIPTPAGEVLYKLVSVTAHRVIAEPLSQAELRAYLTALAARAHAEMVAPSEAVEPWYYRIWRRYGE